MNITKPHVAHLDEKGRPQALFSCSLSPDSSLLLTTSLNNTISIWAYPELKPQAEGLARHQGAVMAARWSPCGRFFASGSDDKKVLVWSGCSIGGQPTWKVQCILPQVHSSDVTAVEWSPDGRWLASGGLDKQICVYAVNQGTFTVHCRLECTGFVKGLAWNRSSANLLCQCDDKRAVVYKVTKEDKFEVEQVISECFTNASDNTFFMRPSYSPDGQYCGLANACNGPIPSCCIVPVTSRNQETISLIGHQGTIEVCKFSPCLYQEEKPGSLVCLGSQDGSLSIWSNLSSTPLVVIPDLFEQGIMDCDWARDGLSLVVCSYEGGIACIDLDEGLVGRPYVPDTVASACTQEDTEIVVPVDGDASPALVRMDKDKLQKLHKLEQRLDQKVQLTKDGKKRITPTLVTVQPLQQQAVVQKQTTGDGRLLVKVEFPGSELQRLHKFAQKKLQVYQLQKCSIEVNGPRVQCVKGERLFWREIFSSQVVLSCASEYIVAVLLQDGHLYVHSVRSNKRLLPDLVVGSNVHSLSVWEEDLVLVFTNGTGLWFRGLLTQDQIIPFTLPVSIHSVDSLKLEAAALHVNGRYVFNGILWVDCTSHTQLLKDYSLCTDAPTLGNIKELVRSKQDLHVLEEYLSYCKLFAFEEELDRWMGVYRELAQKEDCFDRLNRL